MANEEMVDVVVDGGAAVPEPVYADDQFNVFVDETPAVDEATQKLLDDLKANQAELAQAQAARDPVAAMSAGIAALGDRIAPRATPDVRVGMPNVDIAKLKEEYNKSVYDDPFEKTVALMQTFNQMTSVQQANANMQYSKRIVMVDPATKELYHRFATEVEAEVAALPPNERATNPNVYDDALLRVKARHMDELFEERLKADREARGNAVTAAPAARQPVAFSEGSSVRPAAALSAAGARTVRITASKKAEVERYASDHLIPFDAAMSQYERNGWLTAK